MSKLIASACRIAFVVAVAAVAGCASDGEPSATVQPQTQTQAQTQAQAPTQMPDSVDVAFIDSGAFDRQLSQALKSDNAEVRVDVPVAFNLNDIPERMDRWLLKVQNSGGQVVAQPDDDLAMRGTVGIAIEIGKAIAGKVSENMMYGPAGDYDTVLVYGAEGNVNEVIFRRR